MQKSQEISINDVLCVITVHSDFKISLTKDMQDALGGVKAGDRLVVIKSDDSCLIKKREMKV